MFERGDLMISLLRGCVVKLDSIEYLVVMVKKSGNLPVAIADYHQFIGFSPKVGTIAAVAQSDC